MFKFGAKCNKCKLELGEPSTFRHDAELDGRMHNRATRHVVSIWYVANDGRYVRHAKASPPYTDVYGREHGA